MGNRTNSLHWSARERLSFIERLGYWRGWMRRADLMDRFQISMPQASADIAEYLKLNPSAFTYDRSDKRYVAARGLKPVFGEPKMEDGLALLSGGQSADISDAVAFVDLPARRVPVDILRELVRGVMAGHALEVYYFSINSGKETWRWITPRAFANDGYRWHVRAWCHEESAYKDFVIGRIASVRGSRPQDKALPKDKDWFTWTMIRFRPDSSLSETADRAIQHDFGMQGGVGKLRVRKAMLFYTLTYLGMNESSDEIPRRLARLK